MKKTEWFSTYFSLKKQCLSLLFLVLFQYVNANMASPYRDGTRGASAISSRDVHVLSEKIHIKIDTNFNEAYYTITYTIKSDIFGAQIPLLFVAKDYQRDFKVYYDDKPIVVSNYNGDFSNFSDAIDTKKDRVTVKVAWDKKGTQNEHINDLKYFKTDIHKGIHKVTVTYVAKNWEYLGPWVTEKTFRYSLVPAKYWKSFGTLEITIAQQGKETYSVNFDDALFQNQTKTWKFDSLPSDYLSIKLKPKISIFAKFLLFLNPFFLSLIPTLAMSFCHYRRTRSYRRKNVSKRFSIVVILGSIIIPFLGFWIYIGAFYLTDYALGIYASRRHGYFFLAVIFYPVVLLFYWILFWLMDKTHKKNLILKKTQ